MSATQPNPRPTTPEPASASASQPSDAPGHAHRWRMQMHLDFCHYHTTVYGCTRCRATATKTVERDMTDPMNGVWAEEQYREVRRDERGRFVSPRWEAVVCDRCNELKAGAPRHVDLVIIGKDGAIEREEHTEHKPEGDSDA